MNRQHSSLAGEVGRAGTHKRAATLLRSVATGIALLLLATGAARTARTEFAGIRVGMSEEQVGERLAHVATKRPDPPNERERDESQSWAFRRGPYGFIALGYTNQRVRWLSIFLREKGPRMRYSDIGPLASCERPGNFQCVWKVDASVSGGPCTVVARGRDTVFVTSVTVARMGAGNPQDAGDPARDEPH